MQNPLQSREGKHRGASRKPSSSHSAGVGVTPGGTLRWGPTRPAAQSGVFPQHRDGMPVGWAGRKWVKGATRRSRRGLTASEGTRACGTVQSSREKSVRSTQGLSCSGPRVRRLNGGRHCAQSCTSRKKDWRLGRKTESNPPKSWPTFTEWTW